MRHLKLCWQILSLSLAAIPFGVHSKILIQINGTDVYEVPRSKIRTYDTRQSLDQSLKAIQAVKPSSLSDDELLAVPEKYLPPELQEKQKALRAMSKGIASTKSKVIRQGKDRVTIRHGGKLIEVKIDEAVLASLGGQDKGSVLALSRKLPEVEVLGEIKIEKGEQIKSEFIPGDPREIHALFENGQTKDPLKAPLLLAYRQYAGQDFATAATLGLEVLSNSQQGSETQNLARYFVAHAMIQRSFFGTALPLLLDLVTSKWRRSAIGMATKCIEKTRDDSAALQIISKIAVAQIPEEFRSVYSYHLGKSLMSSGAASAAIAAFEKVPAGHVRYPEAQYYIGVIQASDLGSSAKSEDWEKEGSDLYQTRAHFELALSASAEQGASDLRDLVQLSLGRLAYQAKQYHRSIYHYSEVSRDSPFLKEALFESAWGLYRIGEFNRSLGTLHPIGSKYLEGRDFPELWILRSLNYLKLCRFNEASVAANTFEKSFAALEAEFSTAAAQIRGDSSLNLATLKSDKISGWVRDWLLSDPVVKKDNDAVKFLEREKQKLVLLRTNPRVNNAELREAASDALVKIIEHREAAINAATRPYLMSRIEDVAADYRSQKGRLQLLRFEIYSQATKFPEAVNRPQAKRMIEEAEFLPGVFLKGKEILWKFSGEYWWDEVRGYDYFIPTECQVTAKN